MLKKLLILPILLLITGCETYSPDINYSKRYINSYFSDWDRIVNSLSFNDYDRDVADFCMKYTTTSNNSYCVETLLEEGKELEKIVKITDRTFQQTHVKEIVFIMTKEKKEYFKIDLKTVNYNLDGQFDLVEENIEMVLVYENGLKIKNLFQNPNDKSKTSSTTK